MSLFQPRPHGQRRNTYPVNYVCRMYVLQKRRASVSLSQPEHVCRGLPQPLSTVQAHSGVAIQLVTGTTIPTLPTELSPLFSFLVTPPVRALIPEKHPPLQDQPWMVWHSSIAHSGPPSSTSPVLRANREASQGLSML